jgi:hypothetical protein
VENKDRQALDLIANIQSLLEQSPGAAEILHDIRTGRTSPQDAMLRITQVLADAGHGETLVKASSKLTDLYNITTEIAEDGTPIVMKHDNGMDVVNPIMEAAFKERASIDGDVPEARFDAMPEEATPAVPVITDSIDPVIVGYQLEYASWEVAKEIKHAVAEHEVLCLKVLDGVREQVQPEHQEAALTIAKRNLPAIPTGVPGYEAGKRAVPRPAVLVSPAALVSEMTPADKRRYTYKAFATTQGRVSLTPVIERGIIEYLDQHGIKAKSGDPDPDVSILSRWVSVVWGADDLADGFNPVMTAIHSMSSEIMEFTQGGPHLIVQVLPYHGVSDRRFGWTVAAGPKERAI